jgi:hypothetical protein
MLRSLSRQKVRTDMNRIHTIAYDVLNQQNLSDRVKDVYLDPVISPWQEKIARLKRKEGYIDVNLALWDSELFLYGRIYRLLLYVSDALDPNFAYHSEAAPHGTLQRKAREAYNHIWSIYIDSRVEGMSIENFFDKVLRRNLFIDSQKALPWTISSMFFEKLWNKITFTHAEMVDYAHHLDKLVEGDNKGDMDAFELEMNRSVGDHTARRHVESIGSHILRELAYSILHYTASHCKGTLVEASYYGLYFMYDQEIFAEMVTTRSDALFLTLFDFQTNERKTYSVAEGSEELPAIQEAIKTIYTRIANHSQLKAIKNPYTVPTEK